MNTFLPFTSFSRSAKVLDNRRLGKQRVEVLQILRALNGMKGWANHPAVLMWENHHDALAVYGIAVCHEWTSRGFKDTCYEKIIAEAKYSLGTTIMRPWWIGLPEFHLGHQSNLVRKDPEHYGKFFPWVPADLPYLWPTKVERPVTDDPATTWHYPDGPTAQAVTDLNLVNCDGDWIAVKEPAHDPA